ncbi:MAG: hypothetical protein A3H96_13240 [Acidobacteria bacterium RIFCSPLOWO2_02_FULL_67_36]|nr:MAG: hypothetical protein A3H96_13240 [Acidobacteria bacterium RIFCSPLOWO2_02_FULL_67_36]OFW23581.1 MAG: hypothetical protein A3G21_06545 [Acidobacteria bacterium RIFCSPLOWO2_12_FULL_66_21]
MRIGRAEAADLFRVWALDSVLLRCDLGFAIFASSLRGRVRSFMDDTLHLVSDDTRSELSFRMTSAQVFEYADPRTFPDEAEVIVRGLVVFTSERLDDTITFLELKESEP